MTLAGLVFRYCAFAVIATAANLGLQRLVLAGGVDTVRYVAAVLLGTLVGLVVKYALDKRWIFHDIGTGIVQHGTKFTRYAFMGLFTTGIFWGSETAFWLIWRTEPMREIGAVIGLAVGYVIKYQLDARFVFTDALNRRQG
ncbi:MAG: GtrA family protein [Sphingomonadales bacterium]|nr:GtrA family protein [Sphingomonadales bacterium]MBU3992856.1 GtrA family protein [Alphaproteobacteria bacterium]